MKRFHEIGIDLRNVLHESPIESSAPCRIDFGGIWDAKAIALISHYAQPQTVNIALDIRLRVTLFPYDTNKIKVSSLGFHSEEYEADKAPFNTSFGLIYAICYFFRVSGVHVKVASDFPSKSGLGGSGVVAVTTIHAILKALRQAGKEEDIDLRKIVELAHEIEDGLRLSFTGLQDQTAAAFGGANVWYWDYFNRRPLFTQKSIWSTSDLQEANEHILVAYTGATHSSNEVNLQSMDSFYSGKERKIWETLNEMTEVFGQALVDQDWKMAITIMKEELKTRRSITPHVVSDAAQLFISSAFDTDCAARFTGAGAGGCVWAIGEKESIVTLTLKWKKLTHSVTDSDILNSKIASFGLI